MTNKMPNSKIQITEPVTEEDYRGALQIIDFNLTRVLTLEDLKEEPIGRIFLAKIGSEIAGILKLKFPGETLSDYEEKCITLDKINATRGEIGCVQVVVVNKAFQGRGIGKRLLTKGLEVLKGAGARAVLAHIWLSSPGGASEKMFLSFGFRPIKTHKRVWYESSIKMGPARYQCAHCGNPCKCDALEMVLYIDQKGNKRDA